MKSAAFPVFSLPRIRGVLSHFLAMALLLLVFPVLAQPAHVLVSVPTGASEPDDLSSHLAYWRQSGHISSVLRIDSTTPQPSATAAAFTTLVLLEFPSEGSWQAWQREEAHKLASPLVVKRADLLSKGELTPKDSNNSVFQVNTYQPTVSLERYREFVDGYITPLLEGQRRAKILIGYWMYVERGTSPDAPGQSMLVLEYRDAVAFQRATTLKTQLREQLMASSPEYARFHQTKADLRRGKDAGAFSALFLFLRTCHSIMWSAGYV